jgi:hypothetical protein
LAAVDTPCSVSGTIRPRAVVDRIAAAFVLDAGLLTLASRLLLVFWP